MDVYNWEKVDDSENGPPKSNRNIVQPNQSQVLINDCDSSFENEVTAAKINISHRPPSRQGNEIKITSPRNLINRFPEKDDAQLKQSNIAPGNTSHSNIRQERKILLLSHSILSWLQMRLFNKELKTGRAYRKYFPGAIQSEIACYCLPTLEKDKPDVVIIKAGSNMLKQWGKGGIRFSDYISM